MLKQFLSDIACFFLILIFARRGTAWFGTAGHGREGQGRARRGTARHGVATQGKGFN